jgi:hypothetical protein
MIVLVSSVSSAETYKWEDANGVHYSDNAASVPEKYRDKVFEKTRAESKNYILPSSLGMPQPSNVRIPVNQDANYQARAELQRKTVEAIKQQQQVINQANLEQQKQISGAMRQQQAKLIAQSTKNSQHALNSLAKFMVVWLTIGFVVFIIWVLTIVDIVRSEFTTPSNKTVWIILVILLPLFGTVLYCIFGSGQKRNYMSAKDMEQAELIARLKPRDADGKDFTI